MPSRGGQHRCGYTFSTPAFCFNSCPHAEGNLIVKPVFNHSDSFNSCPHAEGNFITKYRLLRRISFQFVPSRGGQQLAAPNSGGMQAVSIRALTRRATQSKIVQVVCVLFQFVPSRGGQLQLPSGRRLFYVSIRALTRRATWGISTVAAVL